jgi:hypothetical protein
MLYGVAAPLPWLNSSAEASLYTLIILGQSTNAYSQCFRVLLE